MIENLIRPHLLTLKPYTCARNLYQSGVLLDANENGFIENEGLNRYPDPESKDLKRALALYLNVPPENIFVGVGSDEIIDLTIRLFVNAGEEVLIAEPTYGMFRVAAEINGAAVKSCPLDAPILPSVTQKTKIIFLCSPNNPTGSLVNPAVLEEVCQKFSGIVVVDEAYIEFSTEPSFISLTAQYENLIILRTFSKAWGLAGARIGYAISSPSIIQYLNKIKPPYNINRMSAALAMQALEKSDAIIRLRETVEKERNRLAHELKKRGCKVFPSQANFILVKLQNARSIAKKLATEYGIIIRDFSATPGLADCVRITIGTPEQNRLLLESLDTCL